MVGIPILGITIPLTASLISLAILIFNCAIFFRGAGKVDKNAVVWAFIGSILFIVLAWGLPPIIAAIIGGWPTWAFVIGHIIALLAAFITYQLNGLYNSYWLGFSLAVDWFTTKLGQVMWWVSLFMVLIGAFNVVTRYAFGLIQGAFGTDVAQALSGNRYLSMQTFAYNLIFMLGAAYVLRTDAHVRVDIIFSNLKSRARAFVDIFGGLLFLLPFSIMGIFLTQKYVASSWRTLEASSDPGGIPLYIVKTLIPIMFYLLIAQGISELIKNIAFVSGHPNSRSIHAEPEPGEHITEQTEAI